MSNKLLTNQYQVGGSLNVDSPTYIARQADNELYEALLEGEFCYVFNCRQMGKSSLRVKVKNKLEKQGYACVSLDMTNIGSKTISPSQWYKSLASELWRGFNLIGKVKLKTWWEKYDSLSPIQQLNLFLTDIVLPNLDSEKVFILIDEIDSVLSLDFSTDDFFALIRYFYNQRAENTEYNRLSFALFGVTTPSNLIYDRTRTPFNIGTSIELTGFTPEEATPLIAGLSNIFHEPQIILQVILDWTGGQPFLTQKLCKLAVDCSQKICDCPLPGSEKQWVEKLVKEYIIDNWESQDEPEHLKTIRDRLLWDESKAGRVLEMYRSIRQQGEIVIQNSQEERDLLLSGLVIKKNNALVARNRIYHQVFDSTWINNQLNLLRPYNEAIEQWLQSDYLDKSRLLSGRALEEAQTWAKDKKLSDLDYRFLTASQELAQQITNQNLEAARLQEIEARLESQKRNDKRQKILIVALSLALFLATGMGLIARRQYNKAISSEQKIAQSQRQTLINTIKAIANSSEALFVSERKLEALIQAIRAKVELKKIGSVDSELSNQVNRNLRRATYGIQEVNRLSGHTGPIWEIDFSPDRQLILSASEDNTAKLWRLDGSLVTTYKGHKAGVWAVDFSQDQTKVITASWDSTVKLWNIEGKLLKTFRGHLDHVWEVEYGPKDRIIASASWDKTAKLWTPEGKLIVTLTGHKDRVWGVDFTKDGKILATASWDKTVKLWDVEQSIAQKKPILLATLTGHQDAVNNVDFAEGDKTAVSASSDGTLIIWDISNPTKPIKVLFLIGHQDRVMSVAYNHKNNQIVSTSDDKTIRIWSPEGTLVTTLKGHTDRVVGLGVRIDGEMIASGGFDRTIRLWQPQRNLLKTLEGHTDGIWQVEFSPNNKFIVSGSRDSTIKLWTAKGKFIRTLRGHRDRVNDVVFHPNSQLIASGSDDRTIKLWNLDGRVIKTLKGHTSSVFTLAFSADGKYLATATEDSEIKIWHVNGELITTLRGHQGAIIDLTFSQDNKILATASRDNTVKLWRWSGDGTVIKTLKGHKDVVYSVAASPDGKIWATSSWDGTIKLWSFEGRELITIQGHESEVNQIKFSPNGQIIASAGADRSVRLWNLQGKELLTLEKHTSKVWSLDFSLDSKYLISAGDDRQIILWDVERLSNLDHFKYACTWIDDYLTTNSNVTESDRNLCNSVN